MIEKVEIVKQQIEFYEKMSNVCLIGTILFGGLTIFIYFSLHIRKVFGQLSGIHKNKEIARIHQNNIGIENGLSSYRQGKVPPSQFEVDKTEILNVEEEETVLLEENETFRFGTGDFQQEESVLLGNPEQWI